MGTNLFVQGVPDPWVIKIKLPKSIDNLGDLKEFSQGLLDIDDFSRTQWPKLWSQYYPGYRKKSKAILLSLRISSDPEIALLADPAWLAVLVAFLVGYKQIKENAGEIAQDVNKVLQSVRGLTKRELQLLEIIITMTMDRKLEQLEGIGARYVRSIQKVRSRLLKNKPWADDGDSIDEEEEVEIEVRKLKDWVG